MTDVKAEAKAVEGAKQVSWFDPTHKDLINKHTTMFIPDSRVTYLSSRNFSLLYIISGLSQAGGEAGRHVVLADQLTLSQPGEAHYAHHINTCPPYFHILRQP